LNTEGKVVKLPLIKSSLKPLVMNAEGKVVSVLPLEQKMRGKISWSCNISCKIDDPLLINRYQKFLEIVNTCTLKNVPKLIQSIHECTMKISNEKLGHTRSCHINLTLCKGIFLPVLLLSPHFPTVRYIKRLRGNRQSEGRKNRVFLEFFIKKRMKLFIQKLLHDIK